MKQLKLDSLQIDMLTPKAQKAITGGFKWTAKPPTGFSVVVPAVLTATPIVIKKN
jgi:hypothetical protein